MKRSTLHTVSSVPAGLLTVPFLFRLRESPLGAWLVPMLRALTAEIADPEAT